MFISVQDYLQRISHALEHVVAPQIECAHVRGQVLAAVFLLDQLTDRIDYKAEIIRNEVEMTCANLSKLVGTMETKACQAPAEIRAFLKKLEEEGARHDLDFRNECNRMLALAIDFFFARRSQLDPALAHELEGLVLDHCVQIAARDLGMLKPSTSMKLLQRRGDQELR